jgi:hypothetical protein
MPKLPKFAIGDLVLIQWDDAAVDSGWEDDKSHATKIHRIQSVGWVLEKNTKKKAIILAADKSVDPEDKETNRRLAIPSSWVHSVAMLKEGN